MPLSVVLKRSLSVSGTTRHGTVTALSSSSSNVPSSSSSLMRTGGAGEAEGADGSDVDGVAYDADVEGPFSTAAVAFSAISAVPGEAMYVERYSVLQQLRRR